MADRERLRPDLSDLRRVELTVDECFAIRHAIAYTFGEVGKDMMRDTGAERWSKCAAGMLMDDAYRKLVAALSSQPTDDREVADEMAKRLHNTLRRRRWNDLHSWDESGEAVRESVREALRAALSADEEAKT